SHDRNLDGRSHGRCGRGRGSPPMGLGGESRRVSGRTGVRLSALVVARNEEGQLADCLAGLGFADEIVVVLDRCRDGSAKIARRFADRLVEGAWEREGLRRHAGIEACLGEWIFEIDADERVTPALAAEIERVVSDSLSAWHLIPVDNYIGARLVRRGWG